MSLDVAMAWLWCCWPRLVTSTLDWPERDTELQHHGVRGEISTQNRNSTHDEISWDLELEPMLPP